MVRRGGGMHPERSCFQGFVSWTRHLQITCYFGRARKTPSSEAAQECSFLARTYQTFELLPEHGFLLIESVHPIGKCSNASESGRMKNLAAGRGGSLPPHCLRLMT